MTLEAQKAWATNFRSFLLFQARLAQQRYGVRTSDLRSRAVHNSGPKNQIISKNYVPSYKSQLLLNIFLIISLVHFVILSIMAPKKKICTLYEKKNFSPMCNILSCWTRQHQLVKNFLNLVCTWIHST